MGGEWEISGPIYWLSVIFPPGQATVVNEDLFGIINQLLIKAFLTNLMAVQRELGDY